jgi:hypothetical protein
MSGIGDDEIVRLAALTLKDLKKEENSDELEREMAQLSKIDFMLVHFATKLMSGLSYNVTSDNPQAIARCRALAGRLGAQEETREPRVEGLPPQIMFRPPARQ